MTEGLRKGVGMDFPDFNGQFFKRVLGKGNNGDVLNFEKDTPVKEPFRDAWRN
jgi:hypothetical protein